MAVGNPATAGAGSPGQMSAAFWNTEVRDQWNQSFFQAPTALTSAMWVPSAGSTSQGATGTFAASYLKHGRRVWLDWHILPAGAGAAFGNAGSTWTFTLPFTAATGTPIYNGSGEASPNGTDLYAIQVALTSTTACVLHGPTTNANSRLVQIGNPGVAGTAWTVGSGYFRFSFGYNAST